ncbi:MAG: ROK family protein [Anaerolineae bacterium]|nr:ROK family protein [Anaerolineae bacterium]
MLMSELYASIDLGGTKIACAFGTANGEIVAERAVPTLSHEGPQAVLARIADLVKALAAEIGQRPAALGMGVPGLVDVPCGVVKFLPNLPTNWRDVPVRDSLGPRVGCPVYLLNDVRTATLGELTFGVGCDQPGVTMAFFALGTGIGGGVVVDGKLRLGPLGAAGELGHQTILPDGPLCGCGNRGCLETLASGPAIVAQGVRLLQSGRAPLLYDIVGGDVSRLTPREMAQAADAGDNAVRDALVRAAEFLGIGVANVIVTLHPDLVVLGGSVAQIGPLLFDTVCATVQRRVGMFPPDNVRIEPSRLGNQAGLLGGIALAIHGLHGQKDEQQ